MGALPSEPNAAGRAGGPLSASVGIRFVMFALLLATARAQDPVDVAPVRDEDMPVVQERLFPKAGRTEVGVHLGVMPLDTLLVTPNVQLSVTGHLSERAALTFVAGGGWGLETQVYRKLESPTFGTAPERFRYLGSLVWGIDWAPIYGKLNTNGARVVHFDAYLAKRIGVTVESSTRPSGGLALGPTFSPAIGGRVFLGRSWALRVEVRDDLLVSWRFESATVGFSQNANLSVGLVFLSRAAPGRL